MIKHMLCKFKAVGAFGLFSVMAALFLWRDPVLASSLEDYALPYGNEGNAEEGSDMVFLDISEGSIYITETGYRIGDAAQETPFEGVYQITGRTREDHSIEILSGEQTVIFDQVDMDQRTFAQCFPLKVYKDAFLHLNICGDNVLYSGSGFGAINLEDGAALDIESFGQGSLELLAYPEKVGDVLMGDSAVEMGEGASISYPYVKNEGDTVTMYVGGNRKDYYETAAYHQETYLHIRFDMAHVCELLGAKADCVRGQHCIQCGREVYPKLPHVPGESADCTHDQLCTVCGQVVTPASGHQGVWKVETDTAGTGTRREHRVCTVCGESQWRDMPVSR